MTRSPEHSKLTVVQFTKMWLPLTMAWLYNELRFLPESIENRIVCNRILNMDQYGIPNVQKGELSKHIQRYKAQILHSHFADAAWDNMQVAQREGIKHIASCYGFDISRLPTVKPVWRARYEELFEHTAAVLCEGEHMADCLAGLGCPREKIRVHRLGVDLERIPFRARMWSPKKPLRVLISGTFTEKKGIPYALMALARIKKEIKDMEITVIGDSNRVVRNSEAEKAEIMNVIAKHQLTECTRLLGYQPHERLMQEAYKHHLFVSPSVTAKDGDTEGGAPVTIIEMAASGMPVASTKHCDIPGVLGKTNKKYLANERDAKHLSDNIMKMLSMPSWEGLLQENRAHIERHFSAAEQGKRLAELYRSMLEMQTR